MESGLSWVILEVQHQSKKAAAVNPTTLILIHEADD